MTVRVPAGLGDAGRQFWDEVTSGYDLSPAERGILRRCCACLDRLAAIDAELDSAGLIVEGSTGQVRAHPLLSAADSAERTFDILVKALSLPMPDEREGKRRSPQAVQAAQARWRGVGSVGV